MLVDQVVRLFAQYLNSCWIFCIPLLKERSYAPDKQSINDWLQVNWELLVERKILRIGDYLEVYGEGADYNGASSRMTDIEALPNYRISINGKGSIKVFDVLNNEEFHIKDYSFEMFVSFFDGWYKLEPPFNHALLVDHNSKLERVIAIDEVQFELEKLK